MVFVVCAKIPKAEGVSQITSVPVWLNGSFSLVIGSESVARLVLFNKPFEVLSQFRDADGRAVLADFIQDSRLRVAGRLDYDSEGLMLLADDGQLVQQISHPRNKMAKVYYAQVEGEPDDAALQPLRDGITLKDGPCLPAKAQIVAEPAGLWPRPVPIRYRRNQPVSWVAITVSEGRNRQVRRMLAHVGFPVLRLVRWQVGEWTLDGLAPGEQRERQIVMPQKKQQNRIQRKRI